MSNYTSESLRAFTETAHDAGIATDKTQQALITYALRDIHLGFVMEDNLATAGDLIRNRSTPLPVDVLPEALTDLAVCLSNTGSMYREQTYPVDEATWDNHVTNVREGNVVLIPSRRLWTTVRLGKLQVEHADQILTDAQPGVEEMLAVLNYETYFRGNTMAGPAKQLVTTPEEAAQSKDVAGMPHLVATNWAIAQTVQHIFEQFSAERTGKMHLVDMCSGTGATLAAIFNRMDIAHAKGLGVEPERLSAIGIEATPSFIEQMEIEFMPLARQWFKNLGFKSAEIAELGGEPILPKSSEFQLIEGDVVKAFERLDLSDVSREDVVVATVNYGWHRIPLKKKREILDKLVVADNVILIVGDLRKNGSNVNRGYFNLSNNGPLNAGNIGLEEAMHAHNFITGTVGRDYKPGFIYPVLRAKLEKDLHDDGFLTVAVRGPKALDLISQ